MLAVEEICIPDIGGAENVEVIEILVQVGDRVELEQALITLETDKATMEVPSPKAGLVKQICIEEGSRVSEGGAIIVLELEAATAPKTEPEPAPVELEAVPSKPSTPQGEPVSTTPQTETLPSSVQPKSETVVAYSSPSIRKLARELDVPLAEISGSGPKQRISRTDVLTYVKTVMARRKDGAAQPEGGKSGFLDGLLPWPKVDFAKFGPVERQPLSRIRKISGANLHRNWVTIPHVTNHEDADITDLEAFRVQLNQENANSGIKVTLVALLIKASVAALKQFPDFNASLDGDEVVLKNYYHIGFAADTPNGLVVPVIRDADKKGILAIAEEVGVLAAKAREGKLTVNDMSGGCFSVSSLGGIGGTYFTPIINAPEIAILGVAKARTQLIWNGQSADPRLILPMSLSWDHRAVDGAMAGRFNAYLAAVLGDLRRMIL